MSFLYRVTVVGEYTDLLKQDDSIRTARSWARDAFPGKQVTVTRAAPYRRCPWCDSAPCAGGCTNRHED